MRRQVGMHRRGECPRSIADARAGPLGNVCGHRHYVPFTDGAEIAPAGKGSKSLECVCLELADRNDDDIGIATDDLFHRDRRPQLIQVRKDRVTTGYADELTDNVRAPAVIGGSL